MHAFLANLTAALLVIHAMIGCCHHHWHRGAEDAAEIKYSAVSCQCCDPCCGTHDENEQPASPCDGEFECHGVCTYLPTQKTLIDESTVIGTFDFAMIIPTLVGSQLAATTLPWDLAKTQKDAPPPLRLHLLHQVLLI